MTPALAAANFRDSAWNASALLSSNFHLTQNENRHFTLCFQGRGDFHASKNGESPSNSGRFLTLLTAILEGFYKTETQSPRKLPHPTTAAPLLHHSNSTNVIRPLCALCVSRHSLRSACSRGLLRPLCGSACGLGQPDASGAGASPQGSRTPSRGGYAPLR